MSVYLRIILVQLLFVLNLIADMDTNSNNFEYFIDENQQLLSKKVIKLSKNIDNAFSYLFTKSDVNSSNKNTETESIDSFFKSEKYIRKTKKRFLRISLNTLLQSKNSTSHDYKIKLQIPLIKSKKRFKLFINSVKENYYEDTTTTVPLETKEKAEVGISYFPKIFHGIESKYSIAIGGFLPYIRARYYKSFNAGKWKIEPTQQFKFSTRDNFYEETNIYFDRSLNKTTLFRTTLHRDTSYNNAGMGYSINLGVFHTKSKKTGLAFEQNFIGHTDYKDYIKKEPFPGINNYVTSFSWRQSVWRDWFVYEIKPAVSFSRDYDYNANYMLRFNVDFYFGEI